MDLMISGGALLTCTGGDIEEQNFIVTYKVLTANQVLELYGESEPEDSSEAKFNDDRLYAFGYIQKHPSYKSPMTMVEITFFNPDKQAFKTSANLGWVDATEKKLFLIYLGNKNQFNAIDYSTKILMQKN
ncbi:MAG: hypothetical protein ACI4OV_00765 [Victivallaceae bacterium]